MGLRSSLRKIVLATLFCAPAALGLAWVGCATADEEVDAVPKRAPRDSAAGDETTIGDETGMIFPGDDGGGPLCPGKTSTPNACTAPTDLGTLTVPGTKTVAEGIAATAGDLWYKVTFGDLTNLAAHPSIVLTSSDPNIVMEVNKSCAGESVTCGSESEVGVARNIKSYEVKYAWDGGFAEDADPSGEAGVFKPIQVGEGGVVYVHVFRLTTGPKTGCDFKLDIRN